MRKINFLVVFTLILLMNFSVTYSQKITSVDEAVKIAIENNPEIKTAQFNIEREKGIKQKAFNIPKPQVFIEFEGVKSSISNFESRKIGISQVLEFPLNYFLRANVQNWQIEIAKQELNQLISVIKTDIKTAYAKLYIDYKLLEAGNDNLKVYMDFLTIAQQKYNAGSTANLEVLRARVNKITIENELKNLQSEILISQSELKKLMNVNYDIQPIASLTYKELSQTKAELLEYAFLNNTELKIINLLKEKSASKLSLSKAQLLPDLSFKYYKQKIGNDADFWGVEFGLGIPLWFFGEQTGNIKEADFELKMITGKEISIKNNIENNLNQVYEEYQNYLRQVNFYNDEVVKETDEIFRQAKTSYEEGAIEYTEYLQALEVVYETKTQFLKLIYAYNKSIINLEKIISGDIK